MTLSILPLATTSPQGLTENEAALRLIRDGENRVAPGSRIRSIFDLVTFAVLWWGFGTRPSRPVLVAFAATILFGLSVAFTPAKGLLHLGPLPLTYLPWLAAIVLAYCACVRWIKPG